MLRNGPRMTVSWICCWIGSDRMLENTRPAHVSCIALSLALYNLSDSHWIIIMQCLSFHIFFLQRHTYEYIVPPSPFKYGSILLRLRISCLYEPNTLKYVRGEVLQALLLVTFWLGTPVCWSMNISARDLPGWEENCRERNWHSNQRFVKEPTFRCRLASSSGLTGSGIRDILLSFLRTIVLRLPTYESPESSPLSRKKGNKQTKVVKVLCRK